MKFRYARHTNNLLAIQAFYTKVIGLEVLGRFENHSKYNGLFIGLENLDWHLEFTESTETACHSADEDDLMVFYLNSVEEINLIKKDALRYGYQLKTSRNPYWQKHGVELIDPDNYGVILTLKNHLLSAKDSLTQLVLDKGIQNWSDLVDYIKGLTYGRNKSRIEFEQVMLEEKGSCSTKHGFLKQIATINGLKGVKLMMGMYKMNASNTPKVGKILSSNGLNYLPEAHCYLKIYGKRVDITHPNSDIEIIQSAILEEQEISPLQLGSYKVDYHKKYLKNWLKENHLDKKFPEIWRIREACIHALSQK